MSLEIQQREREGITLLDMKGRLTAGRGSSIFEEAIDQLLRAKKVNLILNLQHVDSIDSEGLRVLLHYSGDATRQCGRIKLVNLIQRHIELLVVTELVTAFEIFGDEQDAVNSFFPDREIKSFDILNFVRGIQEG